jgi:hypothetical protein
MNVPWLNGINIFFAICRNMKSPVLPHASAMPYFRLTNSLNDTECLTERHLVKLVKNLRECYSDISDPEFLPLTDSLAEYMIVSYPIIFKVQRFIRHCERFNICVGYLLDDTPRAFRYAVEGQPLDPSEYETLD